MDAVELLLVGEAVAESLSVEMTVTWRGSSSSTCVCCATSGTFLGLKPAVSSSSHTDFCVTNLPLADAECGTSPGGGGDAGRLISAPVHVLDLGRMGGTSREFNLTGE